MTSAGRARKRRHDEQGAVAIIVAFSLVALMMVAGIVIDLGLARTDKLTNKGYADAAAMAGIRAVDGGDGTARSFPAVCTALNYLKVNDPDASTLVSNWKFGSGLALTIDPCTSGAAQQTLTCVPNSPSTWAWYTGTNTTTGIQVDIKSGYVTPDPQFDAAGSGDNSVMGGCDQLAVIITQTEKPGLGQLSGKTVVVKVRSVARASLNNSSATATGLILLERHACNALVASGAGQIQVFGNGIAPGTIQADSLGDSCNSGEKVISATISTMIKAHKAETGSTPGSITTTALSGLPGAVPGNAISNNVNICPELVTLLCGPVGGSPVVGRAPVDRRYLTPVKNAITAAAAQYSKTSNFGSTAGGVAYTVFTCSNIATSNATAIFVNCPTGATIGSTNVVNWPNATDVVFNGSLTVTNSAGLSMPKVARFYVKGVTGGQGLALTGAGYLSMNQGSASTCAGQPTLQAARMVIGNGAFTVTNSGVVRLCGTSVIMADNTNNSCPLPTSAAGTGIAPYDNSCGGYISLTGAGVTDWTAPNLLATLPTDWSNLEDLALWTETSANNQINNSGNQQVSGVWFLPNANPFSTSGAGSATNAGNAQFITRRLVVTNSGAIYLKPSAPDTVTLPLPSTFALVR